MPRMLCAHRLPHSTTDSELPRLFEGGGRVINCDVITDGSTRLAKAIGFVEIKNFTAEQFQPPLTLMEQWPAEDQTLCDAKLEKGVMALTPFGIRQGRVSRKKRILGVGW